MLMTKKLSVAAMAAPLLTAVALAMPAISVAQAPVPVAPSVRGLPDFTDLVEQVGPAVVNIRTVERVRAGAGRGGQVDEEMQEFFRRFFGIPLPNVPRRARARRRRNSRRARCRAASARASSSRRTATS